jgi:hypothetical protein
MRQRVDEARICVPSCTSSKCRRLLHDDNIGEPVLVYTRTKPPAPGAAQAGWGDPAKPKTSKETANAKLVPGKNASGKDKDTPTAAGASAAEGASAPKPKPKKPAPKTLPAAAAALAPASTQQTSQAR